MPPGIYTGTYTGTHFKQVGVAPKGEYTDYSCEWAFLSFVTFGCLLLFCAFLAKLVRKNNRATPVIKEEVTAEHKAFLQTEYNDSLQIDILHTGGDAEYFNKEFCKWQLEHPDVEIISVNGSFSPPNEYSYRGYGWITDTLYIVFKQKKEVNNDLPENNS